MLGLNQISSILGDVTDEKAGMIYTSDCDINMPIWIAPIIFTIMIGLIRSAALGWEKCYLADCDSES